MTLGTQVGEYWQPCRSCGAFIYLFRGLAFENWDVVVMQSGSFAVLAFRLSYLQVFPLNSVFLSNSPLFSAMPNKPIKVLLLAQALALSPSFYTSLLAQLEVASIGTYILLSE